MALIVVVGLVGVATGNVAGGLGLAAFGVGILAVFELAMWLIRRPPLWADDDARSSAGRP